MSYRSLHKTNERFELTVMSVLIVAFFAALALMFVHPTGSLVVFFLGLAFLGVAVVIERVFRKAEQAAARDDLGRHACPSCGADVCREGPHLDEWRCSACGAVFLESGELRVSGSEA